MNSSDGGARREFCLGAGAHTHYWDRTARPVAWMLELQFPTITRCSVKNLVTTGIGVNDGFRDAWIEK